MMEAVAYFQPDAASAQRPSADRALVHVMAEVVTHEHADFSAPASISPSQKRKRAVPDSPLEPRRAKRGAPSAAMSGHAEADSASYVETAVEAAQAAAAANVNAADFTALQHAAADHHESTDPANASNTAAAALHVGSMYPQLHVPAPTDATFASQATNQPEHHHNASFGAGDVLPAETHHHDTPAAGTGQTPPHNGVRPAQPPAYASTAQHVKPAVGSDEWHKQRKDNHKEVERRRRETINEGINELAKIVPGCEKNKGSILQRAVSYIQQLKDNEAQNIEKWTLEKLLTEQAIEELSTSNDKLKEECDRAYRELALWKQVAQSAGLQPSQPKDEPSSS